MTLRELISLVHAPVRVYRYGCPREDNKVDKDEVLDNYIVEIKPNKHIINVFVEV